MYGRERNKTMGRRGRETRSRSLNYVQTPDGRTETTGARDNTSQTETGTGIEKEERALDLSPKSPRPLPSPLSPLARRPPQAPAVLLSRAHQHPISPMQTTSTPYCPRPYATPALVLPSLLALLVANDALLVVTCADTKALRSSPSAPSTQPSGRRTSARQAPNSIDAVIADLIAIQPPAILSNAASSPFLAPLTFIFSSGNSRPILISIPLALTRNTLRLLNPDTLMTTRQ